MIESLRNEKTLIAGRSKKNRTNWAEGLDIKNAAQEKADAILLAWYPGAGGGREVAELLFGKTDLCQCSTR